MIDDANNEAKGYIEAGKATVTEANHYIAIIQDTITSTKADLNVWLAS